MAQKWPKITQNSPKMTQNWPNWPKNDPKLPKWPKNDPKYLQHLQLFASLHILSLLSLFHSFQRSATMKSCVLILKRFPRFSLPSPPVRNWRKNCYLSQFPLLGLNHSLNSTDHQITTPWFWKFLSYPYFMRLPCYQHICIVLLPCQIHQKPPWVQHFAVSQAPHFLTFWKEEIFNFLLHSNFWHLILSKKLGRYALKIDNKYQNKYLTYFSPNIFVGNFVKLWTVSKSGRPPTEGI